MVDGCPVVHGCIEKEIKCVCWSCRVRQLIATHDAQRVLGTQLGVSAHSRTRTSSTRVEGDGWIGLTPEARQQGLMRIGAVCRWMCGH